MYVTFKGSATATAWELGAQDLGPGTWGLRPGPKGTWGVRLVTWHCEQGPGVARCRKYSK